MNTIEKALKKHQQNSSVDDSPNTKVDPVIFDKLAENQKQAKVAKNNDLKTDQAFQDSKNIKTIDIDKPDLISDKEQKITKNVSSLIDLDLEKMDHLGFLTPDSSNTILQEEYRQIKRPLLRNIRGKSAHPIKNANIIQVTSSLQSEGKTFTAINLALTFAKELDFNVLLVDADTIKSSMTRSLVNNKKITETTLGLTDYLSGEVKDLSKLMLRTNIPKLNLLPAGSRNLLSTELLNSKYMEKLITEFSQRYKNRIVVIDSPPILQTNDARILAQKVGQIIFVVQQNKTGQSVVKDALSLLEPESVIALIMNKSRTGRKNEYYGYYGYGHVSTEKADD